MLFRSNDLAVRQRHATVAVLERYEDSERIRRAMAALAQAHLAGVAALLGGGSAGAASES